jgi:dTDP-4-amino-4,6-dideoxy-D-galactose acyltransferase
MIDQTATKVDALASKLTYFPHDFVRDTGFVERARTAYAEDLLCDIPARDDLRVRDRLWFFDQDSEVQYEVFAQRLAWDSDFFGYGVARLHTVISEYPQPALQFWADMARHEGIKYMWTVVPDEATALKAALGATGWRQIETRVTYWRTLHDYDWPERYPVRPATARDGRALAELSARVVNPFDRFHADPYLDQRIVDKLFRAWPINSITHGFADAVLVPDVPGEARAWVSLKYHSDMHERWQHKLARPGNGAIDPSMQGWYTKLISECCYHLKDRGFDAIYIPTQATNRPVIAAWQKLGFKYGHTEHVFRAVL